VAAAAAEAVVVVVPEVKTVTAVIAGPPPPPPSSEGSSQTDKNVDKLCHTIRGADSVQLTVSHIAMIIQHTPTHFTQRLINARWASARFMSHLSDYEHKQIQLTVCKDVIKIPDSWMIRFEKMSVFNLSSQINTGYSNNRPVNRPIKQPSNELTPRSRILAENLPVSPLVRRSPVVYET
jgi:hypothetical protein